MNDVRLIAKVPIPVAQLFVAPDGVDRDPDLNNLADRAAMRVISAADYIKARTEKPEWFKAPHRLYCPCCVEKGHLSRHKAVENHDREQRLQSGEAVWMHFADAFHKWPKGPEHSVDCDHADRYRAFTATPKEITAARPDLHQPLYTITLPTAGGVVLAPPRPRAPGVQRPRMQPEAGSSNRLPSLRTIDDIERFVRTSYFDPAARAEKILKTPDGVKSLDELFLNSVKSVYGYCEALQETGQRKALAIVSLSPNRISKFWEGHKFPSQPVTRGKGQRALVVMFNAQDREVDEHLKAIFKRNSPFPGKKVLAYGEVCFAADGRPNVLINRREQITTWDEPDIQASLF